MNELTFNLSQAIALIAIVPSLFVVFYLIIFSRNRLMIIIPCSYFSFLSLGLIYIVFFPYLVGTENEKFLIPILAVGNLTPPLLFLLVVQLIMANFPNPKYFLILLPSVIGEGFYFLSLFLDSSSSLLGVSDLQVMNIMPLYRLMGSLLVFTLLTVFVSLSFKWRANIAEATKHKYWLIIHLIFFNLIMLAVDLIEMSGRLDNNNFLTIDAIISATFVYLVISSMFRVFTDEFLYKLGTKQFDKPQFANLVNDVIERIETLLKDEKPYREPGFNREAMAKKLHLQEGQLSYIINNRFNKSFTELMNDYRVNDATKMLVESDIPITNICFDTGFNSLTSFNRVFKQVMGMSPSDYRSKFRPANEYKDEDQKKSRDNSI